MKKTLSLILFIFLIGALVYFGINKFSGSKSQTNGISINGEIRDTTGVSVDPGGEKGLRETIILIGKGRIDGDGFSFYPPGNGTIIVELSAPYQEAKTRALQWLKDNGYPNIDPEALVYKEI